MLCSHPFHCVWGCWTAVHTDALLSPWIQLSFFILSCSMNTNIVVHALYTFSCMLNKKEKKINPRVFTETPLAHSQILFAFSYYCMKVHWLHSCVSTGNLATSKARVTAASRSLPPQLGSGRTKVSIQL